MSHVDQFRHAGCLVRISYDNDAESPRQWDNLGWMVCWHNRYRLGDWNQGQRHPEAQDGTVFGSPSDFEEWWAANGEGGVILPLYLYDHSGITMSCGPFNCPWDSGQVGYVYCTREAILKEYNAKRVSGKMRKRVADVLKQEVATYDDFLTGQVYGYEVFAIDEEADEDGDEAEGELLDSCWGFFGLDYCKQEAKEVAEYQAEQLKVKREAALDADLGKL